jgi:MFS family permease
MAGVTFVTLLGASGFRSTPGVLIVPLQEQFDWSRATISGAVSVNLLLFGFMGPFAAALMERFGIRNVCACALVTISAGALLTTQMTSAWQLYLLWGVVVGLGTGSMATVLAATVANRWFVERKGLVLGLLTAASATGQLIFLPLLGWLAKEVGWRAVSVTVAIGALCVIPLVLLLMRSWPADVGQRAYGATTDEPVGNRSGSPIRTAISGFQLASRSPDFWLLSGTFSFVGRRLMVSSVPI